MAARVLVQCRMHGGYLRPDWVVEGVRMDRIDEGAVVALPEVEASRLISTFGASAFVRVPGQGEASPPKAVPAVTRDLAALSVRELLPAIRSGDFDDSLDILAQDKRGTVAKAAQARARTIARG